MATPDVKQSLIWLMIACFIGFLVPAIFSMGLRWERSLFLVPYVMTIALFLAVYFSKQPISLRELLEPWRVGIIGVAVATVFLMWKVQQFPPSAVPEGSQLVLTLVWVGVMYGAIDGLLLNVFPVLIVYRAWPVAVNQSRQMLITRCLLALAASIVVTVAYHLGYTEFHGVSMFWVIAGMSIITSTYLLTGSPISAIVTHIIMHSAAVLHGAETVLMLPPHYAG